MERSVRRVKFCPRCGSRLRVRKKKGSEIVEQVCANCYHTEHLEDRSLKLSEQEEATPIRVVDEKLRELKSMSTTDAVCPKCGNGEAYFWIRQTEILERSSTQFLRCTRCEYTWRQT